MGTYYAVDITVIVYKFLGIYVILYHHLVSPDSIDRSTYKLI